MEQQEGERAASAGTGRELWRSDRSGLVRTRVKYTGAVDAAEYVTVRASTRDITTLPCADVTMACCRLLGPR